MEETTDKNIPDKKENGLSQDEHKWLHNWFMAIDKDKEEQIRLLRSMHRSIDTLEALAILFFVFYVVTHIFFNSLYH